MAKRELRTSGPIPQERQTAPPRERSIVAPQAQHETEPPERGASATSARPSENDIRQRAYQKYLERGSTDGRDVEDWMDAERELNSKQ